jgi:hypothetical protein
MDTGTFSNINWLHVLVAAIAYFALGAIWYSFLFRNKWIAYQNIKIDETSSQKGVGAIMFGSFILMLIATIGLAIIVERLQLNHFSSGVKWGLLTGVCFSATAISISYLYVKKPSGLHIIDGLYHIIGQIIAAVILSCWH